MAGRQGVGSAFTIVTSGTTEVRHLHGTRPFAELLTRAELDQVERGELVGINYRGDVLALSSPLQDGETVTLRPPDPERDLAALIQPPTDKRIMVIGGPRTGKTTYALARGELLGAPVLHTDDLIGTLDWSAASEHVATEWMARPGPWIIEGVAAVRALRKWLAAHPSGKPCDEIVVLDRPRVELSKGQAAMAKGCAKIWAEVMDEVKARGSHLVIA